jgi:hypothetical protein
MKKTKTNNKTKMNKKIKTPEIEYEIDPEDNGEEWRQPYKDPWGRIRENDVVDCGDSWLIIDGNGMTWNEPKKLRAYIKT